MDVEVLPEQPIDQVAVLVGTGPSATGFPTADGITPQTVWGHLALQLGGVTAYEAIQREDQAFQAPGANQLKRVIGGRPTLILLDELARYLVTARGTTVGGTTLDQQTTSFLMALMEAVDREPAASLVITMTETTDPFGGATGQMLDTVAEARELMARRERVLRPSDEADLPQILARRLFKDAAEERQAAAEAAGHAYAEMAADAAARGADLPEQMAGAGFATDVARTHPFHPDLVRVLDKRLSTIPSFHRTRGALRLLARTVRRLWEERPPGTALIHLHHIDLGDRDIAEDLSSRLDRPKWEPVIRADVASGAGGEPSHAEAVDQRMGTDFARRLATAAYLFSLTHEVPGVPSSDLLASVLAPGDDPALAARALDLLEQSAWYLHSDPRGLRFSTEVALPKMIADAEREGRPARRAAQPPTSSRGSSETPRSRFAGLGRGRRSPTVPTRRSSYSCTGTSFSSGAPRTRLLSASSTYGNTTRPGATASSATGWSSWRLWPRATSRCSSPFVATWRSTGSQGRRNGYAISPMSAAPSSSSGPRSPSSRRAWRSATT